MLRSRVFVAAALVVGVIVMLELLGLGVGLRQQEAVRRAEERTREMNLNLAFETDIARAAGEGVSAAFAASRDYAAEAAEAIGSAERRLQLLAAGDADKAELRGEASALRSIQREVVGLLRTHLAPLETMSPELVADPRVFVARIYSYEALLPPLRNQRERFAQRAQALSAEQLERWQQIADGLAIGRLAALLVLVLVLTRLMQRRLVDPLSDLARAAKRISEGDFEMRVEKHGDAEIGAVQEAFNEMAVQLGDYYRHLADRERELEQAVRRAEVASEAKSAFVARISHELRTPMHGVLGTAELVLRGRLEPEQRSRLETIRSAAGGLLGIINDVLDLSRLEAGHREVQRAPVDVRRELGEVVGIVESRASEKGLQIVQHIAPELPRWVAGDAVRLRQVMTNLLANAVKFSHSGRIEVVLEAAAGGRARWRFEVRDEGPGIGADALERIFLPFEQADGGILREHGGTGLGLTISKLLVEAMGGEIRVDSAPGRGSRFWFELLLEACAAPADRSQPGKNTGGTLAGHVLVVEDHPVNQTIASAMLEELGCTCDIATNGAEAVERCAARRYDLVLMDCQMPVLDGFSATARIRERELPGVARMPVVAMTAGALQTDREAARACGMDDFLAKPFTMNELEQVIARWLDRAR